MTTAASRLLMLALHGCQTRSSRAAWHGSGVAAARPLAVGRFSDADTRAAGLHPACLSREVHGELAECLVNPATRVTGPPTVWRTPRRCRARRCDASSWQPIFGPQHFGGDPLPEIAHPARAADRLVPVTLGGAPEDRHETARSRSHTGSHAWAAATDVRRPRPDACGTSPRTGTRAGLADTGPDRGSLRRERRARHGRLPAGRPGRRRQQGQGHRAAICHQRRALRSGDVEVWHRFQSAGRRRVMESGEGEDAAGRQGHRRDAVCRNRSEHLLRHGERRLRLHLDRDAARPARLAGGGPHVAHVPDREGGSRRPRRLHRRARDPARARRRRAGAGGAHRGYRRRKQRTS